MDDDRGRQVRLGRNAEPMLAFPTHPFDLEYNLVARFSFDDCAVKGESLTLLENVSCGGSMPWGACWAHGGDVPSVCLSSSTPFRSIRSVCAAAHNIILSWLGLTVYDPDFPGSADPHKIDRLID